MYIIDRIFVTVPQIINLLSGCIQLTEQMISTYARILASQIHVRCRSHLHPTPVLLTMTGAHWTRITPEDLPEGLLTPCYLGDAGSTISSQFPGIEARRSIIAHLPAEST